MRKLKTGLGIGVGLLGAWLLIGALNQPKTPARSEKLVSGPVILDSIQALGELRTQRMNFSQIITLESHRNAAPGWDRVPGVQWLVSTATKNHGMARVETSVDGVIDLKSAQVHRTPNGWTVVLPDPKVEIKNAKVAMADARYSRWWQDFRLTERIEAEASGKALEIALSRGLAEQSRAQARQVLGKLFADLGIQAKIEFQTDRITAKVSES